MHPLNQKIMIIPPNFLVKTIPLYSGGDVSTPHVVINYLTRSLFFILLKFPPNWKLMKVKEIKDTAKKYQVLFIVTFSKMGIYWRG